MAGGRAETAEDSVVSAVTVWVPGVPKPQPRPRAFARGGRARVYDPGTAEGWKSAVATALRAHIPETPVTDAVDVRVTFYLPRPKGHLGTGRNAAVLRPSAPRRPTPRPDLDNLAKAVLDALGELGFWRDDAQVCRLDAAKEYTADRAPGASIWIRWNGE